MNARNAQTKADVPAPPRQHAAFLDRLAVAPTMDVGVPAANNMAEKQKDMSFKVGAEFHHVFKSTAALHRLSMKELLEQSFELWQQKHGKG